MEKSSCLVNKLPLSLFNSTKKKTTAMSKMNLNNKSENENESGMVQNNNTNEMTSIPEITIEELQTAINRVTKGKSPDSNGIRAQDIKACDDETGQMVRHYQRNQKVERVDARSMEESGNRKGRCGNVGHYHQICSLPGFYILFSTVLY